LHAGLGPLVGFPPTIESSLSADVPGLAWFFDIAPVLYTSTSAFVLGTIGQEFWRGVAGRMRARGEGAGVALMNLVGRSRRRYGGYVVHVGIVLMYLGFTGAGYDKEKEAALSPGDVMEVDTYRIRYERPRMEVDRNKRMLFTDMTIMDADGAVLGTASPAKFIYRTAPEQPTSEVSIRSRPIKDLYVIMSTVDAQTKRGTFQVKVRPLVAWIWIGGVVLILGCLIAMWPSARELMGERS
jgi:cytochrome c-type biogenesis protein CcmF